MSYVNIPPAYYAAGRPGTPYHPGGEGWLQANVPGWGENPNVSWAGKQAANGLGAAPPCTPGPCPQPPSPPFSYVGTRPFQSYLRLGISPWGAFPHGRAYGAPRPLVCKSCVGMPIRPGVGALGGGCPACQIESGGQCLPCPEGSDVDGCEGCVGGQRKASWTESPLLAPVVIGVLTAVTTGVVVAMLKKSRVPVSG